MEMQLLRKEDRRARIDELEKELLKCEQVPCPVIHRFGPGIYIREVTLPVGSFILGHHQNFEHTNIMLKGHLLMLHDDGTSTEMRAPHLYVGQPGRKLSHVYEETVWLNIYATDEQDVEKLEATYLTKSEGWKQLCLTPAEHRQLLAADDQEDFLTSLKELQLSPEEVRAVSVNEDDLAPLPFGSYKIKVGPSPIEGKGLFATANIAAGELIAPARISEKRTLAGRYTNHSATPNAIMLRGEGDSIALVALRDIRGCLGGQDGEEITINYRLSVALARELNGENLACQE